MRCLKQGYNYQQSINYSFRRVFLRLRTDEKSVCLLQVKFSGGALKLKIFEDLAPFASSHLWCLLPEFNLLVTLEILLWEISFNPWPLITPGFRPESGARP